MKISLNYLKKYLDFDLPPTDQLIERIGAQLGAIDEAVVDLGKVYKDVIVAKVVDCHKIEGSDHLSLCKIDDGHKYSDNSIRDNQGLIQVVCGANNVETGIMVAWLPPNSVVPNTFHKEKMTLMSKELQGNVSHGMLASSRELMIDDDHNGILVIDVDSKPGDSFSELYELSDHIIDIENKMFTHRPDCFGLIGIARELAGILGKPFKSPDWYLNQPKFEPANNDLAISINNEIPSLVPRFSTVSLDKVKIEQSPVLVRSYLSRMGIRPINTIVDATNLCMLETGQPLHAYDYDKLKDLSKGQPITITVRNPHSGEKLSLINEKTVEPSSDAIVIACNEAVGLGGVMGADNSSISENTKSIVVESATFDMYSIRRTSMGLGIFSDAVTRFNKGQSPLQTATVLVRAVELIKQLTGDQAILASDLIDNNNLPEATIKRNSIHPPITVPTAYINDRLGTELSAADMAKLLNNVECQTEANNDSITVNSPFWRTDIEIREDVIEEVGRLYGFDHIKMSDLSRSVKPTDMNKSLNLKSRLRQILASAGANEVLTYSFVSKRLLNNCGQEDTLAYQLENPLSPDVEYYRLSLLPSLLNKVNMNIKASFSDFALFEIGKSYQIAKNEPTERNTLALVYASSSSSDEPSYYQARAFADFLLKNLGTKAKFLPLKDKELPEEYSQLAKPLDPNRGAVICDNEGNVKGVVGQFKNDVVRSLKLPSSCSGFEVDLELLSGSKSTSYHKLSKYPVVRQDITLKLPSEHLYAELEEFLSSGLNEKVKDSGYFEVELLSVYQSKDSKDSTNYSFRVTIADYSRTLKDSEVNDILDELASSAKAKLQAVRV